jgi:hypothetical protein
VSAQDARGACVARAALDVATLDRATRGAEGENVSLARGLVHVPDSTGQDHQGDDEKGDQDDDQDGGHGFYLS